MLCKWKVQSAPISKRISDVIVMQNSNCLNYLDIVAFPYEGDAATTTNSDMPINAVVRQIGSTSKEPVPSYFIATLRVVSCIANSEG